MTLMNENVYSGVCILLKEIIYGNFNVSIVDKTYDDIMALTLRCKTFNHLLLIIAAYIPPENSSLNFLNI